MHGEKVPATVTVNSNLLVEVDNLCKQVKVPRTTVVSAALQFLLNHLEQEEPPGRMTRRDQVKLLAKGCVVQAMVNL